MELTKVRLRRIGLVAELLEETLPTKHKAIWVVTVLQLVRLRSFRRWR
jgi:hypothetical protein